VTAVSTENTPQEDSIRDCFVAVFVQSYSNQTRPVHSGYFGCTPPFDYSIIAGLENIPANPLALLKNVYNLTPVFGQVGTIIVNETVRTLLEASAKVQWRRAFIERAYSVPYFPGIPEGDFDDLSPTPDKTAAQIQESLWSKFRCPPPTERLYELHVASAYLKRTEYSDFSEMTIGHDAAKGSSVFRGKALVSRTMLAEYGIVFSEAYLFRPDIWETVSPYFFRPYFWAKQYRFPAM